jgi:hypothetical protein
MIAILGPEVIHSYKRLSYTPWYALAEFVDNSTQAYKDNASFLTPLLEQNNELLTVRISHGQDTDGEYIRIWDNSFGMSKEALEKAVIIGKTPSTATWRSKYGLGLKTAACWFGNVWTIRTKTIGEDVVHCIEFDVDRVAGGDMDLRYATEPASIDDHYTDIVIRNLNRSIRGRTVAKIKNYLRSIYRIDITNNELALFWEDEQLNWDYSSIDDRLIVNHQGDLLKVPFDFVVNGKKVWGWAGVFASGSRADAGFSIIQANRVIKGWPESYRPSTLFGDQEGGTNDLVNQRLVGELFLENFEISHTKDEILFTDEEIAEIEDQLLSRLGQLRSIALSYRKYEADIEKVDESDDEVALAEFLLEMESKVIKDLLRTYEPAPADQIKKSNQLVQARVTAKSQPTIKATIDELTVFVYLEAELSPNDPYVIIDSTTSRNSVTVIINRSHPHWDQITGVKAAVNFIRHCVYDGVSEWKCYQKTGSIQPDTVKRFKDALLRVPFEIEQNEVI